MTEEEMAKELQSVPTASLRALFRESTLPGTPFGYRLWTVAIHKALLRRER